MWVRFNNNPIGRTNVGDCAVRSLAKALNIDWEEAYLILADNGLRMADIMNSNIVIAATLRQHGFRRTNIPDACPDCFTIADFAQLNPSGIYVLGTGSHVVAVEDGKYFDTWDCGNEVPIYVWYENINPHFGI